MVKRRLEWARFLFFGIFQVVRLQQRAKCFLSIGRSLGIEILQKRPSGRQSTQNCVPNPVAFDDYWAAGFPDRDQTQCIRLNVQT